MRLQKDSFRLGVVAIPVFLLGLLLAMAPTLMAQVRSASITGTVKDPTGAVVAGASVVAKDTGRQETYSATTDKSGDYTIPYLSDGDYSVTISKDGFKQFAVESLHLDQSQVARVDAALAVGANTETVQVEAQALHLQTETSEVAGVTTADEIEALPNITQTPFYYVGLQNGVVPRNETQSTQSTASFGVGVAGRANDSAYGVNGGRAFENSIQLDGLPVMGDGFNEAAVTPNLESMQEVQVHTNDFSAEYGQGQGVINVTTKSGTNAYHGQFSYLNRNQAFNANTAQNKSTPSVINGVAEPYTARPIFKVNDVGGAVTGPIRKDHVFFSASFHWLKRDVGGTSFASVPTDLERTGDFGDTLFNSGNPAGPQVVRMFNPWSSTLYQSPNIYSRAEFPVSSNCNTLTNASGVVYGGGQSSSAPNCGDKVAGTYPGGTLPDAAGLTIMKAYPEPNVPNAALNNIPFTSSNLQFNTLTTYRKYTSNDRIDWKRGKHSVYGTGGVEWGTILAPAQFGSLGTAGLNDAPNTTSDRNPYAQVGDSIVLSSSLFLDVRYGITRIHAISFAGDHAGFTQYGAFGIAAGTQALFATPELRPGHLPLASTSASPLASSPTRKSARSATPSAPAPPRSRATSPTRSA